LSDWLTKLDDAALSAKEVRKVVIVVFRPSFCLPRLTAGARRAASRSVGAGRAQKLSPEMFPEFDCALSAA